MPYICSKSPLQDSSWNVSDFSLLLIVIPVLMFAARKMFPKRKLEESRSGSESVKEEIEVKEDLLQQNKRPRVESSPVRPGTWLPLAEVLTSANGTASYKKLE